MQQPHPALHPLPLHFLLPMLLLHLLLLPLFLLLFLLLLPLLLLPVTDCSINCLTSCLSSLVIFPALLFPRNEPVGRHGAATFSASHFPLLSPSPSLSSSLSPSLLFFFCFFLLLFLFSFISFISFTFFFQCLPYFLPPSFPSHSTAALTLSFTLFFLSLKQRNC